jgi:hypothetical protein
VDDELVCVIFVDNGFPWRVQGATGGGAASVSAANS